MFKNKKIHFMGIEGSGISGVASLASKMGYQVTGCDIEKTSPYLTDLIDNIQIGHSSDHIQNVDLVVASPAIFYQSKDEAEFLEAKAQDKLITWQEFLGKYLHKDKKVICVAGTHGKSTTTAMTIKLLEDAGMDPLAVLGAKLLPSGVNYRFGKGKLFVTEADEFFDNFLNYHPEIVVLNNIEFDHPDFFKSEEQIFESYKQFIGGMVGQKTLILNEDDLGVKKLLTSIDTSDFEIIKYSLEKNPTTLNLKVMGKHNVSNSLGVMALGKVLGIEDTIIKKSLEEFNGIGRRMELIGERDGVKIYDDYAHHPTAIKATLKGLRDAYPTNKIWAIVELHGFDRTNKLLHLYENVFENADEVVIGPIFKARDTETFDITPKVVAQKSKHNNVQGIDSFNKIRDLVKSEMKKGDIILVMGAGKSYIWAQNLLKN